MERVPFWAELLYYLHLFTYLYICIPLYPHYYHPFMNRIHELDEHYRIIINESGAEQVVLWLCHFQMNQPYQFLIISLIPTSHPVQNRIIHYGYLNIDYSKPVVLNIAMAFQQPISP